MVTNEIRNSMKQALTELRIAEYELNRNPEDVVTMSVCYSARQSLVTMLQLFLLSNDIGQYKGSSLRDLLDQAINIDNQFSKIDASAILCDELNHSECDGKFCLTVDKVVECVAIANQFKIIVLEKMKINESEMK